MELGKEIKFCGFDWYIINQYEDNVVLMMKDILSEEEINKYIKSDPIMVNGSCVRYNDNIRHNEWELSYIHRVLNGEFLNQNKELKENIIEIRLPKKEEIEELDYEIRQANDWYWTCTPYETDNEHYIKRVWYVDSSGGLDFGNYVNFPIGSVRPAVVLKSSNLESVISGNKTPFGERTLPAKSEIRNTMNEVEHLLEEKINEILEYLGAQE